MKNFLIFFLVFVLTTPVVLAETQGQQTQQRTQNQGEETEIQVQNRIRVEKQEGGEIIIVPKEEPVRAQTREQLREMIQEREQEMSQETEELGEELGKKEQKVFQNQNQIRLTVHSLLAMEDLIGGIGPQVSEIAREFNNSVQATINAEKKIQQRSSFTRFFLGGNKEAAKEIEQEVNRNQERLEQLLQLKNQCACSEEVKAMFQEQIQSMEQEQNRLKVLAEKEQNRKGLFGWFIGLFK